MAQAEGLCQQQGHPDHWGYPIYVALDSADAWANPGLFQLDKDNIPTAVAGVPPDGFSPTGQLWGNPLYRWEAHRTTGYQWWITRLWYCFELYDVVRIDHFRGFDEYFSIPYGSETARRATGKKAPASSCFVLWSRHWANGRSLRRILAT